MRLVGTPVTEENFKAWQKAYMEEMGETLRAEREREDGKITGRRYFETRSPKSCKTIWTRAGTIARKNLARTTTMCFLRRRRRRGRGGERVD